MFPMFKDLKVPNLVTLSIGCDGLSVSRSSNRQIWPILCKVDQSTKTLPFVIAIFYGVSKPNSLEEFLSDFVSELKSVHENGILVGGNLYTIRISFFAADAPARSFLKSCAMFNAYFGCEKCNVEGDYRDRVVFLNCNCILRTDESFRSRRDEEHHKDISPLESVGIGMVTQFPLDFMHLVCLGVVRKMLYALIKGPLRVRLASQQVKKINQKLEQIKSLIPNEFARKCRTLDALKHFKATEFRLFVLYVGPFALQNEIRTDLFKHFLLLHTGIFILATKSASQKTPNDIAQKLLVQFVTECRKLYGAEFLSYNVHSLIHLAGDCLNFGSLDDFSCFPFENHLQFFRRRLRSRRCHAQQIVNRITEQEEVELTCSSVRDSNGYVERSNYDKYRYNGYLLSRLSGNNCFLLNSNKVVIITSLAAMSTNLIECRVFDSLRKHDEYPVDST